MSTRCLPVPLTREEIETLYREGTELMEESINLQAEAKAKAAFYKDSVNRAETCGLDKLTQAKSGIKNQFVDVEYRMNFDAKTVECYRMDTGEFVDSRIMTETELQATLDFSSK